MTAMLNRRRAPITLPPPSLPIPEMVLITPELAREWLAGNTANRKIRTYKVNQYASDMAAGRWTASESAICRTTDGQLLNGQHRMLAVIQAGIPVWMLVLQDVPIEAMPNMDTGTGRTAADGLRFQGERNAPLTASAGKLAIVYSDGRIYRDKKLQSVSGAEIKAFIEENPDLRDSVETGGKLAARIGLTGTAVAVAHWLYSRASTSFSADLFLTLAAERTNLEPGSPILALDSRVRQLKTNRTRLEHRDELYLLVKAWNYWRTGRPVQKITVRPKGEYRIPAVER